jgi:hypothetical protein
MKRIGWILLLMIAVAPAWSANKKLTIAELKAMLVSMQDAKKGDADVATALKGVDLTEELTRTMMNSLVAYVPGQLSTEQMYVLEAKSAMLAPPAEDIPTTPAPDAAAQKALLDKAIDYATKTYGQLPELSAVKTTLRFQDNVEAVAASSGMHGSAQDMSQNAMGANAALFVRYINSSDAAVELAGGAEKPSTEKDKTPWGANGQVHATLPGPALASVIQEAEGAGKISWMRWETVNGKQTAVFSFGVDKKKTHYAVNYCCFPDTEQAGIMVMTGQNGAGAPGGSSGGGGGAKGNFQTNTTWKNYKASVPYHGEIFVNAETGIIVRLDVNGEFKSSDVVHYEDTRVDYGPVTVGDKTLVLPVDSFTNTEVVPGGEDSAAKVTLRHTFLNAQYKNYQLAGGH